MIPLFLLHLPCGIVFLGPVFFNVGWPGEAQMIGVRLYPIFEPLVVIYFLNKRRIQNFLQRKKVSTTAYVDSVALS